MATAVLAPELDPDAPRRAERLRALGLLTEVDEQEFDELLRLATLICGKPLGAMTLLDETTQLMKARIGFRGSRTMPVRDSICQYTVRGESLLMVEDVSNDPRFKGNKTLEEDAGIRFYAGMPLRSEDGLSLGALCVMDTEPSTLSPEQQQVLEILGRQLSNQLQLRERTLAMARMTMERERSREMFDTILNHLPVEVYLKDAAGHLQFYNRKLAERFHISKTEWLGKTSFDLWDETTARHIVREDEYVMKLGRAHESLTVVTEHAGNTSYWRSIKVPCTSTDGEPSLACCSIDVTEQMKREEEMQRIQDELEEANRKLNSLALTDSLTGLWNRRAFDARLETSVMISQRSNSPMALMLLDVDNFKSINDRFGHPYGDVILKNLATILNRVKRGADIACRFGGEEFAVLMPESDIKGAIALAERLLAACHSFAWEKEPVTVSIGLAMCSDACSSDELVDAADAALYDAKKAGKNRYVVHGNSSA